MKIKRIDAFQCTDGKVFTEEKKATEHQTSLAYTAIDNIMYLYSKENPEIHYPALSYTLVPFMSKYAKELIKSLKLSI